ncbi:hypothetical protein G4B88_000265 [Cannabis sativa]|uniref:Uncharacterized protein n=1 Tax=Cannabis sativa TaxID=3483 RepID=A0A7J6GS28_CANSA|nr:hypothetical protein G4B88_000265 [Cannabis sativa]
MYCSTILGFSHNPATVFFNKSIPYASKTSTTKNGSFRAKPNDENDPLLQAAINAASLQPLFHDPYAGCFISPQFRFDDKKQRSSSLHYLLTTKFIDDKLVGFVNQTDGLKQGMELNFQKVVCYVIFHWSPRTFSRLCALMVLMETGLGLPVMTLSSFEEILITVSGLATKGCSFLGVLPAQVVETNIGDESSIRERMEKLFLSNGFRVEMIKHEDVAKSFGKLVAPGNYKTVLFVAEQLRFSDDQMETWRSEFQRLDEEGDEEGFEEL